MNKTIPKDSMSAYKPDWKEAQQRMTDWWAGKKVDRVPAQFDVRKNRQAWQAKRKSDVPDMRTDLNTVFSDLDNRLRHEFYGGETIPSHCVYLGPMFHCTFFGCQPNFCPDTTWYDSPFAGWGDVSRLTFDPENEWFRLVCEITRRSVERAQGRYLVTSAGNSGSVIDLLCELFGADNTLVAMIDKPDEVKMARDKLVVWSKQIHDKLNALVSCQEGSLDMLRIWAPGRIWTVQCDISVTMSPAMFREFVVEELRQCINHVNYSIYHLDGKEQIRHLDALLEIKELDLIQWVPGTVGAYGSKERRVNYDPMTWIDLFRKIQNAGKKVIVFCPSYRIKDLLNAVDKDRIFLAISCDNEQMAWEALAQLEKIGC